MNDWIQAARLRTLPLASACVLMGAAVGYRPDAERFYPVFAAALVTVLLLQILSNYANDLGDAENGADGAERTDRAVASGRISRASMRRAVVVTTISQASKDELRKWVGPLADKVVVVPDCVFEEFAHDPKPFNEECPVVLQVGTKWNKNVERVMEAMEGTGCRLEIVGTTTEDQKTKRLKDEKAGHGVFSHSRPEGDSARQSRGQIDASQKKASHGWTRTEEDIFCAEDLGAKSCSGKQSNSALQRPRVRELGRLTDEELVEAYRRCDMVVFASLYEGFGLPILEAQAMGRPVITSNFGAMREAAGDGALLVDPYSVEEIRAAILRLKNEPGLREELVRKGRENAERFRGAAVAERYAEIYRRLKD